MTLLTKTIITRLICELNKQKILRSVNVINSRYSTDIQTRNNVDIFVQNHPCLAKPSVNKKKAFYILEEDVADSIAEVVKENIDRNNVIVEVNPGPGILTQSLLKTVTDNLIAVESNQEFLPYIQELQDNESDKKLSIINYDVFDMYKNRNDEKLEQENEIVDLLPKIPWTEDISASIIGILHPRLESWFMTYIAQEFCQGSGLFMAGRLQWFLFVSPRFYRMLISKKSKKLDTLFELLFDIKICHQVPISNIYPKYSKMKITKMAESVNENVTYLIKFTPKPESFDILHPHEINKFILFLKQLLLKSSERLIPRMEELVPGCGMYLIKDGFSMMQSLKTITPKQCLQIFKLLPSIPYFVVFIFQLLPSIPDSIICMMII
ncbi:dimethyladenosine transferase 2, mitochondrial [Patella vulgata]|uniref:dimethyladenosine transferase 2, mitochondrial n=1 Tax=Patella vulgata TaxID=6465 RepID=UPI0024A7FA2A|nr:dimethyladenosine transferase 2, mitochondrial [Patella vulgata]